MTSNETCLNIATADIFISEDLYFNISPKPILDKVLELSRNISETYITPNINIISK